MNITVTLALRPFTGLQEAAQRNGQTVEQLCGEILELTGRNYANLYKIGMLTSAAFVRRIKPEEYGLILAAAQADTEVADLVQQLTEAEIVFLDDERLPPALELLVTNGLLTGPERVAEILAY